MSVKTNNLKPTTMLVNYRPQGEWVAFRFNGKNVEALESFLKDVSKENVENQKRGILDFTKRFLHLEIGLNFVIWDRGHSRYQLKQNQYIVCSLTTSAWGIYSKKDFERDFVVADITK